MVVQYPHTLTVFSITEKSFDDEGNIINGGYTQVYTGKCRVEINTKNNFIIANDGSQLTYTSAIYFPLPKVRNIQEGDKITVIISNTQSIDDIATETKEYLSNDGNYHIASITEDIQIISATIKAIDKGSQLNNRLWV